MSKEVNEALDSLPPEAEHEIQKGISKIWLLPLIALLIGLGMLYKHWQGQGIPAQIVLTTAEGIEAGKTKIKSRNVKIGSVTDVSFSEDRQHIVVDILVDKSMRDFLREDSQFWVVRPRVNKDGISGIGTLFSGAYIEVSPGISNVYENRFVGLDVPPKTSPNAEGLFVRLISDGGTPLDSGDPVIYRGLNVGQVEFSKFDVNARTVNYLIFVRAPFHDLITTNTVFWKASGISVSATAKGFSVDIASFDTLISGGIEFGVPEEEAFGTQVESNYEFVLYNTRRDTEERRVYDFIEYVVLVEDSVSGLSKGAPVEYRGVRIGTVFKPFMTYEEILLTTGSRDENRIPVVIRLEPERVAGSSMSQEDFKKQMRVWIKRGVTASVESSNLITGQLKISLDNTGTPIEQVESFGPYPVIPARQGGFAGIAAKVDNILYKIDQLPLESLVVNTRNAMSSVEQTMSAADDAVIQLQTTLSKLTQTLIEAEQAFEGVQPGGEVYASLQQTLKEVRKTMEGLQPGASGYVTMETTLQKWQELMEKMKPIMARINNQPNALLFGSVREADEEPQAAGDEQ